jgi:hypothetical protein
METAEQVKLGTASLHSFTLRQVYDETLEAMAKAGREAGEKAGLTEEQIAEGLEAAISPNKLPDEFFEQFDGEFRVHRPSVGESLTIENQVVMLGAHIPEDKQTVRGANIARAIATVRVVVTHAPPWYKNPMDLTSWDVVALLYEGYRRWVDSFRF